MKRYVWLYFIALTLPLFLGLTVWQSTRYSGIKEEINRLEKVQADWVESNKRLIASIAVLSSPERIEYIARNELDLSRILPEDVLQVKIEGGNGYGF
jgi:cell division protein FtsL